MARPTSPLSFWIVPSLLLLLVGGCGSFGMFELPTATPEGEVRIFSAVSVLPQERDEDVPEEEEGGISIIPSPEVGMRIGLVNPLDVGFKLGLLGFEVGTKVTLIDSVIKVAVSPAIHPVWGFDEYWVSLPLLVGYQDDLFALTLAPRALYFMDKSDGSSWSAGVSIAPWIHGDDLWYGFEVTLFTPMEGADAWSDIGWQVGAAGIIEF